eukprot:1161716-Pelagomonas_calceolata.AAC.10
MPADNALKVHKLALYQAKSLAKTCNQSTGLNGLPTKREALLRFKHPQLKFDSKCDPRELANRSKADPSFFCLMHQWYASPTSVGL